MRNINLYGLPLSGPVEPLWRWLTHVFTHVTVWHLISNLACTPILLFCERHHGSAPTLVTLVAAALTAALWMRCTNANELYVGASGATYGMGGFALAYLALNYENVVYPRAWVAGALLFMATELIVQATVPVVDTARVSHLAHAGGLAQGMFVGVVVGRNLHIRACEQAIRRIAGVAALMCVVTPISILIVRR